MNKKVIIGGPAVIVSGVCIGASIYINKKETITLKVFLLAIRLIYLS
jgi:UDP-3-O-[3-hydroxymyristoyl] glucosamine N-acyltransferase